MQDDYEEQETENTEEQVTDWYDYYGHKEVDFL